MAPRSSGLTRAEKSTCLCSPAGSYVVTEKSCDGYIIDEAQRIIELKPNEDAQFVLPTMSSPPSSLSN